MNKGFYRIYIGSNVLQLISTADKPFIWLKDSSEKLVEYVKGKKFILKAIEELEAGKFKRIVMHAEDLEDLFEKFQKYYTVIPASGGLVVNEKEEILTIFRRKHWDLPKGKLEGKESKREAAVREVKEECGLKKVELVKKIGVSYHTFGTKTNRKLKPSNWYYMTTKDTKLTPQKEEDIEKAVWFSPKEFMEKTDPIYPNIKDVFEEYLVNKIAGKY